MQYPPQVLVRSKELWLGHNDDGQPRSFEDVAKLVNQEFKTRIPKKTLHEWSVTYGWTRASTAPATTQAGGPLYVTSSQSRELAGAGEPESFDWLTKKAHFLREIAGLTEDMLAAIRDQTGAGTLMFRDGESATKTVLALLEAQGKILSGKYDAPEAGDMLPKLDDDKVRVIMMFFESKGQLPMPDLRPGSIDVVSELV